MATGALSPRNRAFLNNRKERPGAHRGFTAAATPLNLLDKVEARRLRVLRQGWQEDAMNYVDAVPELSFAYRFMQHCSSRMRYYPALVDPDNPDGPPVPMRDVAGVPAGLVDAAQMAMSALGVGQHGMAPLQKALSWNFGVPGEAFMLGQLDDNGQQTWGIRSVDEFIVYEDTYRLREVPLDPQGQLGWIDLDPAKTYAARMWVPHPRWQKLATSPMRALLDVAEELLLLSRDIRATARSRLVGSGILKIPEGLRMQSFEGDNADGQSDEWFGRFADALMAPLAEEGTASAVVPIAITGEIEALNALSHMLIERPYSALAMEQRAEAIGRIGTGLDIPREVLEGMSDPNHWGAWLVSDDTFRHHIEPQVIEQVDAVASAFLRPWLSTDGFEPYWVRRSCVWYDPVELITKPDPMANAIQLHDRFTISNAALREAGGFKESDAPGPLEVEFRMLQKTRTFPPNMVEAIFHKVDPDLAFPPISTAGTIPGIGPSGEISAEPPAPPPGPTAPTPTGAPTGPPALPQAGAGASAPSAPAALPSATAAEPLALAARSQVDPAPYQRLSRKLTEIDTLLRARVQTAATSAMLRLLDRAGAKLRTRAAKPVFTDAAAKERIAPKTVTNAQVASTLGQPVVAALGFPDPHALLDPDWGDLRKQFEGWTAAAQSQAVKVACQLAGEDPKGPKATALAAKLEASIGPAWTALEAELNARAEDLLYNPAPNAKDEATIDPNTVVKAGIVRRALAIAGGGQPAKTIVAAVDFIPEDGDQPAGAGSPAVTIQPDTMPDGQIGTGSAITTMLTESDNVQPVGYEWSHGPSQHPFEPHDNLDGVSFSSWTSDVLVNDNGWPDNEFYFPGDHDGCFPAGTVVSGPGSVGATLRDWQGELVEISLASGEFLSATPNHPILTTHGWVAAGELREGDEVIRCLDSEGITDLVPNHHQMPARIEEVADTFGVHGSEGTARVPVAAENFHGDGTGSQVAVVGTNSDLRDGINAALRHPRRQDALGGGHPMFGVGLSSEGGATAGVKGVGPTPLGSVGGLGVSPVLLRGEGGAIEDAGFLDRACLDALFTEALSDGHAVDTNRAREARQRLAGLVAPDKVIKIERRAFTGHVYNLDTCVGWYIAGAIIVGNCSCDFSTTWGPADDTDATTDEGSDDDSTATTDATGDDTGSSAADDLQNLIGQLTGDAGPASQAAALRDLSAARDATLGDVETAGADARQQLAGFLFSNDGSIGTPAAFGQRAGEDDWYTQLSGDEKDRLRNNGWINSEGSITSDVAADAINASLSQDMSTDDAMTQWVDLTRRADAASLLESTGRLPNNMGRFGDFNWQTLAPDSPYDVAKLFAPSKTDAAGYLAEARTNEATVIVQRELNAHYGPAIFEMTYDDYAAEVTALEATEVEVVSDDAEFGEVYSSATQAAMNRLNELLPPTLAPNDDVALYTVWSQARALAQTAGLPVAG